MQKTPSDLSSDGTLRPDIALAWQRASLNGLDPGMEVGEPASPPQDYHRDSRLLRAASPVLSRLSEELADTRFTVLLADERAQIIDRRVSARTPFSQLERVKAVPGAHYREEYSGTNSLATPFETGRPISVIGEEHFLESLRVFACYGAPVIHPLTRRLAGVIDITGPSRDASDLLRPVLLRAVADVQDRLLEGSRETEQRLLHAFQTATARTHAAIVAYGGDIVLTNDAAQDLLTSTDHAFLRAVAPDLPAGAGAHHILDLPSGHAVTVDAAPLADRTAGAVLTIRRRNPDEGWAPDTHSSTVTTSAEPGPYVSAKPGTVMLITGEPGTGRTTYAVARGRSIVARERGLAEDRTTSDGSAPAPEPLLVDCSEVVDGVVSMNDALRSNPDVLVIDDVHLLPQSEAEFLRSALRRDEHHVIFTALSATALPSAHRALVSGALVQEELTPLRDSGAEFPRIVDRLLTGVATGSEETEHAPGTPHQLRVVPSALAMLAEQDWPGNLTELAAVLSDAARGRCRGDITLTDLPATHRAPSLRRLTRLERAERSAILGAMSAAGGNKKLAAVDLGIGRTTLYQRLHYYRLTV